MSGEALAASVEVPGAAPPTTVEALGAAAATSVSALAAALGAALAGTAPRAVRSVLGTLAAGAGAACWIGAASFAGAAAPLPPMKVEGMLAKRIPARPSVVRPMASGRLKPSRGDPK